MTKKLDTGERRCPCGGSYRAVSDGVNTPYILHTLPMCQKFEELDVLDFMEYARYTRWWSAHPMKRSPKSLEKFHGYAKAGAEARRARELQQAEELADAEQLLAKDVFVPEGEAPAFYEEDDDRYLSPQARLLKRKTTSQE